MRLRAYMCVRACIRNIFSCINSYICFFKHILHISQVISRIQEISELFNLRALEIIVVKTSTFNSDWNYQHHYSKQNNYKGLYQAGESLNVTICSVCFATCT